MISCFVRRWMAVFAEGLLVAAIVAMLAGLTGLSPFAAAAPPTEGEVLEGTLVVRHGDDFVHGQSTSHSYFLLDGTAETELAFQDEPPDDSASGQRIRVTGGQQGRRFLVAAGGTQQAGGSSNSTAPATGLRSVAVVLLKFSNSPTEPYTPSYAKGVAFSNPDSVSAYYADTSWGQLTLTGDVFGWYTLPDTNDSCAISSWATSATTAASAAGVDLGSYDNVVYAFPYVESCPWSGLASMPGRSSWLNGSSAMSLRTMAHELGHNFGTHHASSLSCTENGVPVALSATCTSSEYGDPFSVMGSAGHYEHTNFSRGNFGWLSKSQSQTVTATGDYTLHPIELDDASLVQVLRVPRSDSGTYLTLELREASATLFDSFSSLDPVTRGVTVRLTAGETSRTQTRLVDSTPATGTVVDGPLVVGGTLVDPVSGVSITTLAVSASGASVHIDFGSPSAPTPAPTATPAPTPTPTPMPTPGPTATPSPTPTTDAEPPTSPTALSATLGKGKKVALTWTASSDNIGVAGYRVFRDGIVVGMASGPSYADSVPGRAATHTWFVVAYDDAGNQSPASDAVSIAP